MSRRHWPFPGAPLSREVADFLDAACREGFRPYCEGDPPFSESFGAGDEARRAAFMIHRGASRRWEPRLCDSGEWFEAHRFVPGFPGCRTVMIEGFPNVAAVALAWLRGEDGAAVFARFRQSERIPHALVLR